MFVLDEVIVLVITSATRSISPAFLLKPVSMFDDISELVPKSKSPTVASAKLPFIALAICLGLNPAIVRYSSPFAT